MCECVCIYLYMKEKFIKKGVMWTKKKKVKFRRESKLDTERKCEESSDHQLRLSSIIAITRCPILFDVYLPYFSTSSSSHFYRFTHTIFYFLFLPL